MSLPNNPTQLEIQSAIRNLDFFGVEIAQLPNNPTQLQIQNAIRELYDFKNAILEGHFEVSQNIDDSNGNAILDNNYNEIIGRLLFGML